MSMEKSLLGSLYYHYPLIHEKNHGPAHFPLAKAFTVFPLHSKNAVSILDGVMRNGESEKLIDGGNYGYELQGISGITQARVIEEGLFIADLRTLSSLALSFPWGPANMRSRWRSEDGSRKKSDICSPRSHF